MARRRRSTKYKLNGLREYINVVSRATAAKGAETIVYDLKRLGPYYAGEFEEAWVVKTGDKRINASKPSALTEEERRDDALPLPRRITPVDIPILPKGADSSYTIGNEMEYRNIAMDLVPGRWSPNKKNTAPQDWYVTYIQGGGLKGALAEATNKAGKDPAVRGFKGVSRRGSSF